MSSQQTLQVIHSLMLRVNYRKAWKEIGTGNWVTHTLREGYALPFTKEPEPASFNNNRLALNNREFVTGEILDLLSSGRIREVDIPEVHTINPLTVSDSGEKQRP